MKTHLKSICSLAFFIMAFFMAPSALAQSQTPAPASNFTLVSGSEADLCTVPTYSGEAAIVGRFIHNHVLLPYRNTYEFRPAIEDMFRLPLEDSHEDINKLLSVNLTDELAAAIPTDRTIKISVNNYKAFCEGNPQIDFVSRDDTFPSQQGNFILISGSPDDTCSSPVFLGEESLSGTFIHNEGELGTGVREYEFVLNEEERSKLPLQNIQQSNPSFNQNLGVENLSAVMPIIEQNLNAAMAITVDKYSANCEGQPVIRLKINFPDVTQDHESLDAIQLLKSKDVVSGYPDGTFKPDQFINRAEFTKIVLLTAFKEDDLLEPYKCFDDVTPEDWFARYICTARSGSIIKGYADGNFKPDQTIILAEALKILMEVNGVDYEETPVWHEGIMAKAKELDLIPFDPAPFDLQITRGQMASMAAKFLQ